MPPRARREANDLQKQAFANLKQRKKGYQIYRPFCTFSPSALYLPLTPYPSSTRLSANISTPSFTVIGSIARPIPSSEPRPPTIPSEHTHRWTIYVRGINDAPISYWLRKATFQLHETYTNRTRTIDSPGPFEVSETGWGEFEVRVQLYFVPEANEKAQVLWHAIKLHPPGNNDEEREEYRRKMGGVVINEDYNEVVFSEPTESFFEVLTSDKPVGPVPGSAGGGGRGGKGGPGSRGGKSAANGSAGAAKGQENVNTNISRTAEIPAVSTAGNPYSLQAEEEEVEFLEGKYTELMKFVEEEKEALKVAEEELEEVKKL